MYPGSSGITLHPERRRRRKDSDKTILFIIIRALVFSRCKTYACKVK
jgi:hypothetical protein